MDQRPPVDFRILGPLELVDPSGRRIDLGAPRQKAVLAVLLVHLNEVVSVDRLIDELWGETPPNAATSSLQAYVSNLRRVLEPDRPPRTPASVLVTEAPGYVLRVPDDQVDATRFVRLAEEGRRALDGGDPGAAIHALDLALALWRGDALADFAYGSFAASTVSHLHELRATAEEDRVEAKLIAGDDAGTLAALGRLVSTYPLRERLRALQIRALYGAGRQAEALRAFEDARRLLAEELGLEPGRELQVLYRQVLEHDPRLDTPAPTPRPHAPASAPPPRSADVARRSAFVGRDAALARLEAAVAEARAGRSRMVLVEGEPGIGKTSLVAELAARAEAAGFRACWGRCHDDEGAPPLWPWVQILRALGAERDVLPEHLRAVVATVLPEVGPAIDADLAPDAARFRLYDAVRAVIERCATDRPAIVILDDLHWADVSSQRLLRFLAVELGDVPLLVAATFRNTEETLDSTLGDTLADIARRSDVQRIVLTGISEGDVADLLRLTTTVPDDLNPLAAALHRRTDGNPFFVTELVRLMQSERRLGTAAVAAEVPAAVSDVIRRRISRLPDDIQTVLGVAAVIGRRFDLDVLAQACGLDAERTLDTLEAALVARIVVENTPGRYQFAHALVSETLYSDLAPPRRVRLHGRVAAAIESTRTADLQPHYNELAHHYGHGPTTLAHQALTYARLAAEQASARMAYDEAVALWRAALAALERTPGVTPAVQTHFLLELAAAERRAGNLAASSAVHDRALAAARRSNDHELLGEAAIAYGEVGLWQVRRYGTVDEHVVNAISDALDQLDDGDSALRARLLTGLAVALYYREGDRARCQSLVREAVAMARQLGNTGLLATSLVELIVMLDAEPDQTEQLSVAAELATLRPDLPHESLSTAATRIARVALASGDMATFDREIEAFARRATATRHPDDLLWATWARVALAFLRDRFDEAERLAGDAFAMHQKLGIWGAQETYAVHLVLIWREQGRMAAMAPLVEPLLAQWVHPSAAKLRALFAVERGTIQDVPVLLGPDPVPRSRDFTWLAEACITAELAAAAGLPCRSELYQMLLPLDGRVVTMDATFLCLGAVAHYLGLLAASLDRVDAARRHFEDAIELNDAVGAAPWSRRSRAGLAELVERQGPRASPADTSIV